MPPLAAVAALAAALPPVPPASVPTLPLAGVTVRQVSGPPLNLSGIGPAPLVPLTNIAPLNGPPLNLSCIGPTPANANAVAPPTVAFAGVSKETGQLTFRVTNPNAEPLPFAGYTPESYSPPTPAGAIQPIYRVELRAGADWKPHEIGWCGTGKGPVTIPAGATVLFSAVPPGGEWDEVKVGVTWFAEADRKTPAVAWGHVTRKDMTGK